VGTLLIVMCLCQQTLWFDDWPKGSDALQLEGNCGLVESNGRLLRGLWLYDLWLTA